MADAKRAIQDVLNRSGLHVSATQVVEALEQRGIEVSEEFVSRIKGQMFRAEAKAEREKAKRPPQARSRSRPQQRKIPPRRG